MGCVHKHLTQQEHTHNTHILKKKTCFCHHKGGVADNTNYILVSASDELSGTEDPQFGNMLMLQRE